MTSYLLAAACAAMAPPNTPPRAHGAHSLLCIWQRLFTAFAILYLPLSLLHLALLLYARHFATRVTMHVRYRCVPFTNQSFTGTQWTAAFHAAVYAFLAWTISLAFACAQPVAPALSAAFGSHVAVKKTSA